MKELYEQLGISSQVYDFCHEIEESLKERFEKFDKTAEYNQMKAVSYTHLDVYKRQVKWGSNYYFRCFKPA